MMIDNSNNKRDEGTNDTGNDSLLVFGLLSFHSRHISSFLVFLLLTFLFLPFLFYSLITFHFSPPLSPRYFPSFFLSYFTSLLLSIFLFSLPRFIIVFLLWASFFATHLFTLPFLRSLSFSFFPSLLSSQSPFNLSLHFVLSPPESFPFRCSLLHLTFIVCFLPSFIRLHPGSNVTFISPSSMHSYIPPISSFLPSLNISPSYFFFSPSPPSLCILLLHRSSRSSVQKRII